MKYDPRSFGRLSALTLLLLFVICPKSLTAQYQSAILQLTEDNRLIYHSDAEGNRIQDFSYAGYKNGEVELPDLDIRIEIGPVEGDNTAHIQAAIDQVSARTLDTNGFRGAVLLAPGEYPIYGTIRIRSSGVVLRGAGDGNDPGSATILKGIGTDRRTLIVIGHGSNSKWGERVDNSKVFITNPFLPAGSRTIRVENASAYQAGDNIIILHPSFQEWIDAVNGGDTHGDAPWRPNEINMYFNRFVTRIEGNKIQFDVPLYDHFDLDLSKSFVYKYTRENLITESGIEDLRIDIETSGPLSEDHVWNAVDFIKVEDCWARNVTALHFGKSGFWLEEASRCTVLDCKALEPHSEIAPPDRYNFYLGECSNNILFKRCHASEARHAFVSNGTASVSGIVFTGCSSEDEYSSSESHRRWGEALLWDNTSFDSENTDQVLGLHNRGSWGTGHGWTGTNMVAWNIRASNNKIVVQKPPIGQNYAIACKAEVTHIGPFNPHPPGWIEGTGEQPMVESLYETQLAVRLEHGVMPDAPGRLTSAAYSYTEDTTKYVTLTWYDVALDETHYILERSADSVYAFEVLDTLDANTEMYTDSDLEQEDYFYRLSAINDLGMSAFSNVINANSYDPPDTSKVTFQVNMREVEDLQPDGAVWVHIAGLDETHLMTEVTGTSIYQATYSYLEETELVYHFGYQTDSDHQTQTKFEDTPAPCGDGNGFRTLTVLGEDVVLTPVGFGMCVELPPAGSDITDIVGTTIKGSNDDEPWIDGATGAGSPPGERVEMLIDNNLQTKYLVRAIESWVEISSDSMSIVNGYTITSANDVPARDPKAWALEGLEEVTGEWTHLHEVSDNPVWEERIAGSSWTFANDQKFRTYRLVINEINGDNQGLMQISELQIFGEKASVVLSAEDQLTEPIQTVYPNPSSGLFSIRNSTGDAIDYRIFNVQGQQIANGRGKTQIDVDLTSSPRGLYILNLRIGGQYFQHKVILN